MSEEEEEFSHDEPLLDSSNEKVAKFTVRKEASEMWGLAWPLIISFGARMIMASTDYSFVGHITNTTHPGAKYKPADYLAASTLSDMVVGIISIPPLAFNQVLNPLVSQAMGAKNYKLAGIWLQCSMFWLALTSLPFLAGFLYVGQILHLLGFSQDLCDLAGQYARWSMFWPIPNGWYQCLRYYFQAQSISRPAMYNNVFFIFVNILLNWVCVFGGPFRYTNTWNGFGFKGAAISISFSRCLQPFTYWLYMFCYRKEHLKTWPGWTWAFLRRDRLRRFMEQSLPKVGTMIFQATVYQSTTLMIGQLGKLAVSSSSAIDAINIVWSGAIGVTASMLAEIRVGYYLGAGKPQIAKKICYMIFIAITIFSVIGSVIFLPLQNKIMAIITSDVDVQQNAARLLPAVIIATYLSFLVEINTGGVFSGQGRNKLATILSFAFELPASIGSVALVVFYFHKNIYTIYWVNCIVNGTEMIVTMVLFSLSNWSRYAREARIRQEVNDNISEDTPEMSLNAPTIITSKITSNSVNHVDQNGSLNSEKPMARR